MPLFAQAHALAVGERVSLLKFSPCSGKLQLAMLALEDVSHAVPLLDVSESGGKGGEPKRLVPAMSMRRALRDGAVYAF